MRILIVGGDGMLGHQLLKHLQTRYTVKVTLRQPPSIYEAYGLFDQDNAYYGVDVLDIEGLTQIMKIFKPEIVINAVGAIKQRSEANEVISCLEVNALFPHRMAERCGDLGARLFQISTDCVFRGTKGNYCEEDASDALDLYGRSKSLGELSETHCITLRTSIIGLELMHKKSLIEWFLAQNGTIKGYRKAIYSGLTTLEVGRVIEKIILEHPILHGLWHIASDPISKYQLLKSLNDKLNDGKRVIEPDDSFVCDRSLCAEKFNRMTNYIPPTWDSMLTELAEQIRIRNDYDLQQ